MGKQSDRRQFVVHVLQPDREGFYDLATSATKIIHCADVHSDGRTVTCYVENPDGSLLKASFPAELITEIDELVPAKAVRAAKRRLTQLKDEPEKKRSKRGFQDPAYR